MTVHKINKESTPPAPDTAWFPAMMRCGVMASVDEGSTQWVYLEMSKFELLGSDTEAVGTLSDDFILPLALPEHITIDVIELLCLTLKRAGTPDSQQALDDLLARLSL